MNLDRFSDAYNEFHNKNPRYSFTKTFFHSVFYYEGTFIFAIPFCTAEMAAQIVAALNAAFLEGWMFREQEEQRSQPLTKQA